MKRDDERPGVASANLFQDMLELIEDLAGVSTVIYDRQRFTARAGRPDIDAEYHGHRSGFCRSLRVTAVGDRACIACDVEGATAEAGRRGRPFLHTCHAGLAEMVIPVLYRGDQVATVFCGQAEVEGCPAEGRAWLARRARALGAAPAKVLAEYRKLPRISERRLVRIGELLFSALNYLAEAEGRAGLDRTLALYRHPPVRRAVEYVDEHFAEPVGAADVARHCCVTPAYFSRAFHKVMGVTFSEHLTRRRIDHARELLCTTSMDMSAIAAACGYAHQSYFGRNFKRVTGRTPRAYRRENRRT